MRLAWDTLLSLDGPGPLRQRLERALREAIRSGRLSVGSALPPSRVLAAELGCSRWVVTEVYGQLVAEGYLQARTGSATRVLWSPDQGRRPGAARPDRAARPPRFDLVPGLPDLGEFPRARWADAARSTLATLTHDELGYPDPVGYRGLREALAEYLPRCRGAVLEATEVAITGGVTDAVSRICRQLLAAGVDTVAMEDPGWVRLRSAVRATGIRVQPVEVDAAGLRVDRLDGARAVIVTAAHQFPTGVVLAPERRVELIRWASTVDGLVIEDDYDAEFRYDRRPVAVLQSMAPGRVVLLGSLSKTLSPALGLGWATVPRHWRDRLQLGPGPSVLLQATFARFLEQGQYDRQLRRMRRRYRTRRDALVAALARRLPDWTVGGVAAGLHVVLRPPGRVDVDALVERAAHHDLRLSTLDSYRAGRVRSSELVIGYGNLTDRDVGPIVSRLAAAAADIGLVKQ